MIKLKKLISENLINEATRSQIGVITKSGNILSTYVHYDGYPDGVGATAKKYYSGGKVTQLLKVDGGAGISVLDKKMDGGKDHSFANPEKDQTIFYGRDRGEKGGKHLKGYLDSIETYIKDAGNKAGADYVYLYNEKDKKWYYADVYSDKELKLLEGVKESVNEATDKKTLELIHIGLGKPKSMPNPVNVYGKWKSIQTKYKLTDKALGDYLTSYFKNDYERARKFYTSESVNESQVINKKTGKDITKHVLDLLSGKIDQKTFEKLTGLKKESVNEAGDFAGWIAIFNGKKLEIDKSQAKDLYNAKLFAIKTLKVPKSKVGMLAIKPAVDESIVNEAKYDIGMARKGNGLTIYNRAEEEAGDYKNIAHIDNRGNVKFYDKKLPSKIKNQIEDEAKKMIESMNENKSTKLKSLLNESFGIGELPSSKLIKMKVSFSEIMNEGRASAKKLLQSVVNGETDRVEGIKMSKEMAQSFLDWQRMSPYGKKYGDLPFHMLFKAAFNWGLHRHADKKSKEYKELEAKAKTMKK